MERSSSGFFAAGSWQHNVVEAGIRIPSAALQGKRGDKYGILLLTCGLGTPGSTWMLQGALWADT